MKIRTLISTIRNSLKEQNVDSVLTNRDIWNIVWLYAVTYIQREVDQKRSTFNLNIFKVVDVKFKEDFIVDPNVVSTDCTIYKSANKIPKIVESRFGYITKYITTLDRSRNYTVVNPQDFPSKVKLTKGKGKFVYFEDGYLFSNDKYPLKISALFSDLKHLLKKEGSCKVMDLEAPIPEHTLSDLLRIVPTQLGLFEQKPMDTTTNLNSNN